MVANYTNTDYQLMQMDLIDLCKTVLTLEDLISSDEISDAMIFIEDFSLDGIILSDDEMVRVSRIINKIYNCACNAIDSISEAADEIWTAKQYIVKEFGSRADELLN